MNELKNRKIKYKNIRSLSLGELEEEVLLIGESKFRAKQIFDWIHKKLVVSYDEMKNIPKNLTEKLRTKYSIFMPQIVKEQISKKDGTRKFLIKLEDSEYVECVLMSYSYGKSICVSTQVGCRMGCRFCASTMNGLKRNLECGEILGEVYAISKHIDEKISHIVLMGMGEPLDNYDNAIRFIKVMISKNGQNISVRNITLSTCGIVPNMRKLEEENLGITLALSLHGSSQEKRKKLMPIANKYELNEVIDACKEYFEKTKRRISFEYALVSGENDTDEDVDNLVKILKGTCFHLNVIPVNPVVSKNYKRPDKVNVKKFCNKLIRKGVNVTVRREMGSDIDGACGQLRGKEIGDKKLD